jgi:pimeloyl-ACP methyl ester carboxylesterase
MPRSISVVVVSMLFVVACGGGPAVSPSPIAIGSPGASLPAPTTLPAASSGPTASAAVSQSTEPAPDGAKDGKYVVAKDGRQLALVCWGGEGSATVILESGGANIEEWTGSGVVRRLAGQTRVCTYDRAGTGSSDPPPYERRDADDVVSDLKALLVAADIDGPYVLVGRSFGGMIVTHYAETERDQVIGVVVLDTPAPSATFTPESEPGLVWDYPGNTERLDVVGGFENRFAKDPPKLRVPLLVITPVPGEGSADDESFWLQTSRQSRQVEVACGGGATEGACADEVAKFVAGLG